MSWEDEANSHGEKMAIQVLRSPPSRSLPAATYIWTSSLQSYETGSVCCAAIQPAVLAN